MFRLFDKLKLKHIIIAMSVLLVLVVVAPVTLTFATNLNAYDVKVKDKGLEYTGEGLTPKLKVSQGFITLEEGDDYTIEYSNNVDVGDATVTIEGTGRYSGSISKIFKINKAQQEIEGEKHYEVGIFDSCRLSHSAETDISYSTENEDILKIDEDGDVTPVAPGTVKVKVIAEETDTHKSAEKEISIEVTETPSEKVIRGALEWARAMAADDSYTYGRGRCPKCHGGKKVYDCVAFIDRKSVV